MRLGKTDVTFVGGDMPKKKASPAPEPYKKKTGISITDAFVPVERSKEENPDRAQIKIEDVKEPPKVQAFPTLPREVPENVPEKRKEKKYSCFHRKLSIQ
jgi:hypothetical protein